MNIKEDQTEAFAKEVEGFLGGTEGKESAYKCRKPFDPWVGNIPWRGKWVTHSSVLAWRIP